MFIKLSKKYPLTLSILLFSFSVAVTAKAPPSPESIDGTKTISAETLIQLVQTKPDIIIIDSRIKTDRQQGHIEGSISLADEKTNCTSLAKIISHKKIPVIFYCNGPKCGRSAIAVNIAIQCGYNNTYWFRGGFEIWKKKKYPFVTH